MTPKFSDEKCPSCGAQMVKGYVIGSAGVYWNDHIPRQICKGEKMSDKGHLWNWLCPNFPALRCKKCRIIRY